MADRRRSRHRGSMGSRDLAARLRREARGRRPPFSSALHDRVRTAIAASTLRPPIAGHRIRSRAVGAVGGLAAAVALACAWLWPAPQSPPTAGPTVAVLPGIERLPTPGEIGAGVVAEVTTLAAAAVGVPSLEELAALDPVAFAPADEAGW